MEATIKTRRLAIFSQYYEAFRPLSDSGLVKLPVEPAGTNGNGHMFYLLFSSSETRAHFIDYMKKCGVITPFHYVPLHSSPAGKKLGRAHGDMSVTNKISETLVRLPMFFDIGSGVNHVIHHVQKFFGLPEQ